jgi:hypothetical protein
VDTVCAGSTNVYDVLANPSSTYAWQLKGDTTYGKIAKIAGHSDSILIHFSLKAGIDTLLVIETNSNGCTSDTAKLAIVILPAYGVVISGSDSICVGNSTNKLSIIFTGKPPFSCRFTNGIDTSTVSGLTDSVYRIKSRIYQTSGVYEYQITEAGKQGGCPAPISGTASIAVFPTPRPGPIKHE